nr:putative venom toxin Tcis28 [Tityus cisandinus]
MKFTCFILILFSLTLINPLFFDMKVEACRFEECFAKCTFDVGLKSCLSSIECKCLEQRMRLRK